MTHILQHLWNSEVFTAAAESNPILLSRCPEQDVIAAVQSIIECTEHLPNKFVANEDTARTTQETARRTRRTRRTRGRKTREPQREVR